MTRSWIPAIVAAAISFSTTISLAEDESSARLRMDLLVQTYFQSDDMAARQLVGAAIEEASGGSVAVVSEALQRVSHLWKEISTRTGVTSIRVPTSNPVTVKLSLPPGYDASVAHPALVCMQDSRGSPLETMALARRVLGDSIRGFVLIAPTRPVGGSFHQPRETADDLPAFLVELRRRIHLDTDRLFLFGYGAGGDAAWCTALFHPDAFAGVIVLASYPHVPYAAQTYRFLLRNLRRVPILTVWGSLEEGEASLRHIAVYAHNRAIGRVAREESLPIIGREAPSRLPLTEGFLENDARAILAGRRPPPQREVSRWFRYPGQGEVQWVRMARFEGAVWEGSQVSIRPAAFVDSSAFITKAMQDKMAYVGGRIVGQTIEITARKCARVELLMPSGLLDLERPVIVRCNGKIRFEGLLQPDIRTLLETAYERWDFQRLTVARLSFSIKPHPSRR